MKKLKDAEWLSQLADTSGIAKPLLARRLLTR
jgi:hypothetical protein